MKSKRHISSILTQNKKKQVQRVVIDQDAGADDLLALYYFIQKNFHKVEKIFCTYGNFTQSESRRRTVMLLKMMKKDKSIQMSNGATKPLKRPFQPYYGIHGKEWTNENFVSTLFDRKSKEKILKDRIIADVYICIGPLTTLAKLISQKKLRVKKVFILGGALHFPGNATPVSEANFYWDPEAVRVVFSSGLDLYMFPLNVSDFFQLRKPEIEKIVSSTAFNKVFDPYINYYVREKKSFRHGNQQTHYVGAAFHDLLPFLFLDFPEYFNFKRLPISLAYLEKNQGMVVPVGRREQIANFDIVSIEVCTSFSTELKKALVHY